MDGGERQFIGCLPSIDLPSLSRRGGFPIHPKNNTGMDIDTNITYTMYRCVPWGPKEAEHE